MDDHQVAPPHGLVDQPVQFRGTGVGMLRRVAPTDMAEQQRRRIPLGVAMTRMSAAAASSSAR
jgi:hypothetical protein